jgi:uncharacterized membrane protein YgdD (TMEM256/DUF423 family)
LILGYSFIVGIALFSCSLYGITLTEKKYFGMITPFGGLSFIFGWFWLAWKNYL